MASLNSINEDANALCYVWLTFALLIVAAVCFAAGSAQSSLFYAGAVFMVAASVAAFAYLSRYVMKKHRSCCTECCEACCCSCCKDCCKSFVRCILCLPSRDSTPTLSISRRDRQRIDVLRRALSTSDENNRHRATVSRSGEIYLIPVNDSREGKIQALEQEIVRLRQDYDFLKRQECVDSVVQQDYEQLDMEEAKLLSWRENRVMPTDLDIKTMKGRLKRVARNFRLARSRMHSPDEAVSADTQRGIVVNVDMDAPEQVRVFEQSIPVPPAYSETDPQPTSTQMYSQQNAQAQRPYVIPMDQNSSGEETQTTTVPRSAFVRSPSAAYDNLGYLGNLTENANSSAPPTYEIGAPPSYEQATASPV